MNECFDAWEDAAFLGLPKLPIPELQFVIKLRVIQVTTGELMVRSDQLCSFLLRQCWNAWEHAAFPDKKFPNYY